MASSSRSERGEEGGVVPSLDVALLDLFKIELEMQCKALNEGLIALEDQPRDQKWLEALMRAAHSVKGAARIVGMPAIVRLAHVLEDGIVAAQQEERELAEGQIDRWLRAVDFFSRLAAVELGRMGQWVQEQNSFIEALIKDMVFPPTPFSTAPEEPTKTTQEEAKELLPAPLANEAKEWKSVFKPPLHQERALRITAQHLNRLMGLAGESLVESRWFEPFEKNLRGVKNRLKEAVDQLDLLRENLRKETLNETAREAFVVLHSELQEARSHLSDRLTELDGFIRRHSRLSDRLYQEVVDSRMRPFADGVEGFPRMVRDLAHQLGKKIKLDIEGRSTLVDRDILELFESPLSHLLRNAVDHGIELPEVRQAAGKPAEGVIRLEARRSGGSLAITVADDGQGIDIEQVRSKIIEKNLLASEEAAHLTDSEVLGFLFLPGFSTSGAVTEISGRGVGLNVVQSTLQEVGGSVHVSSVPGHGVSFHLRLPLTLSVIRALLVEISGEPYAFPLARIDRTLFIDPQEVGWVAGVEYIGSEGEKIPLIPAWEVLELDKPSGMVSPWPVIVAGDRSHRYAIVVDRLIGEKELVVQELDPRLGKIPDISAGALMEDGAPVLIIDVEEMVLSMQAWVSGHPNSPENGVMGRLAALQSRVANCVK